MNDEVTGSIPVNGSMVREKYAVASVKAFIENKGEILILRESFEYKNGSQQGRFVIPGGKVNEGENFEAALKREVAEECGLEIKVQKPFHVDEWFVDKPGKPKHIVGTYFKCKASKARVLVNQEFSEYRWIKPEEYDRYDINDAAKRAFRSFLKE